jgi:hypothetical protein
MKNIFLFLLLLASVTASFAQRVLNQDFKFTDGLYQHIQDFKKDAPSFFWKEYEGIWSYNTKLKCYQVEKIFKKNEPDKQIQDSLWGFSIRGVPYIRISPDSCGRPLTIFAEIAVRGVINAFSYEKEHKELIPMRAYNPLTGNVFRKGLIQRNATTLEKRIFNLNENLIIPYDPLILKQWMDRDKEILRALNLATEEEYQEKLVRAMMVFNQRYPFFIPK